MPVSRPRDTRDRILRTAADLLGAGGLDAVTFDSVASRLGVTKQAVIYWFPSKVALLSELALPGLQNEARAAIDAAQSASSMAGAAQAVVRAITAFHMADLPRFRLMYLAPQISTHAEARRTAAELMKQIHPVTAEMYSAIATALGNGPRARETAVALHMAALGHVLMVALTDAIDDPLRQAPDILAVRLASVLAVGVEYETGESS